MKDLDKEIKKDKIEIVGQQEISKGLKLVGKTRKVPGHTLFEFNYKTNTLRRAEFIKQENILEFSQAKMAFDKKVKQINKVKIEENCIYVQALNLKNAIKVLRRDYKVIGEIKIGK